MADEFATVKLSLKIGGIIIKKTFKHTIAVSIVVGISGLIYFYPMQTDFKLSLGVIAYGLGVLIFSKSNNPATIVLSGLCVFVARVSVMVLYVGTPLNIAMHQHYSAIGFYLMYGSGLYFFCNYQNKYNPTRVAFVLVCGDLMGNLFEATLAMYFSQTLFVTMIFSALIRSSLTLSVLLLMDYQRIFITRKEQQKKYSQLHELISNVYAEVFYLKKSIKDIDSVMEKSYCMYSDINLSEKIRQNALDISKDIHEIRKDFDRAIKGFNVLVDSTTAAEQLKLSEIKNIIEENIRRIIQNKPDLTFSSSLKGDIPISRYYDIFTVVNNLITNAIDACGNSGNILVKFHIKEDRLLITVTDTGCGITEDLLPYIFSPGFTTKFNCESGDSYTGIGLCHVDNMVKELGGNISVTSQKGQTSFFITIPLINIT